MSTSSEKMRAWHGPALLIYGFRPFFLFGAAWAALAMVLWILMLSGVLTLPTTFDAVTWHTHEFLFGYLYAIVAGFLLTAVPNWTGRLPVTGWPLAGLFALWLAGRLAVAFSEYLTPSVTAAIDLAMPVTLGVVIVREICIGRNWKNLIVLALFAVLIGANGMFHCEAASGEYAAQGYGVRAGLGAGVMMIGVIGGRIVPSFTRNWLVKQGDSHLPAPPMGPFDKLALLVLLITLAAWVVRPLDAATGVLMVLAGLVHLARLARWAGHRTGAEPLVWVLHAGYGFIPLGALALGLAILAPETLAPSAAQHVWMAGAVGLMTLAVMTRATLGHTGRPLTADRWTASLYVLLVFSIMARVAAGAAPEFAEHLYELAGLFWIAAFGGFAALFGPLLLTVRKGV